MMMYFVLLFIKITVRTQGLPADPLDWEVLEVGQWADNLLTKNNNNLKSDGKHDRTSIIQYDSNLKGNAQGEDTTPTTAGNLLRTHGVTGECLIEVSSVFDDVGITKVGEMFTLKRARVTLIQEIIDLHGAQSDLVKRILVKAREYQPTSRFDLSMDKQNSNGGKHGWSTIRDSIFEGRNETPMITRSASSMQKNDNDNSNSNPEDAPLFSGLMKKVGLSVSKNIATTAARRSSKVVPLSDLTAEDYSRKSEQDDHKQQPMSTAVKSDMSIDKFVFTGNLSKEAAHARMQQAKVFGLVLIGVELIVTLSGTTSIWPHMSAAIPGVLFIQQGVTSIYSTCFMTAVAAVAVEQEDGSYLAS